MAVPVPAQAVRAVAVPDSRGRLTRQRVLQAVLPALALFRSRVSVHDGRFARDLDDIHARFVSPGLSAIRSGIDAANPVERRFCFGD